MYTEDSVYLCTGSPLPSDIQKILHSLLNDNFEDVYEFVQDMQVSCLHTADVWVGRWERFVC